MKFTIETVERAYELLRATPPFNKWGLPPEDEISFAISDNKKQYGHCAIGGILGNTPQISISAARNQSLYALILTMAHEMCHLKRMIDGDGKWMDHGSTFQSLRKKVCREHLWDPGMF